MRVRTLMITAFIGAAFAACAGAETPDEFKDRVFGSICEARCACEECPPEKAQRCAAEQDAIAAQAQQKSCADQATAYSECVRQEGRCVDSHHLAERCNVQAAALAGCLDPVNNCPTAGDGICDEPEGTDRCPSGTDPADCLSPCPSTGNGICDEPEGTDNCPAGTDVADCKLPPCESVNDGLCDEPEGTGRCAEGSDVADCKVLTCASVNNGLCDEPEGTGLCPEGTDAVDCGAPTCGFTSNGQCDEPEGTGLCPEGTDTADCFNTPACDSIGVCGNSSSGCWECALGSTCVNQADACFTNGSCLNLSFCLESCFDQVCMDDCAATYSAGITLFNAVADCVVCSACYVSCNGFDSGC